MKLRKESQTLLAFDQTIQIEGGFPSSLVENSFSTFAVFIPLSRYKTNVINVFFSHWKLI